MNIPDIVVEIDAEISRLQQVRALLPISGYWPVGSRTGAVFRRFGLSVMKLDISFVLKSGHFHLLTTLTSGRCPEP